MLICYLAISTKMFFILERSVGIHKVWAIVFIFIIVGLFNTAQIDHSILILTCKSWLFNFFQKNLLEISETTLSELLFDSKYKWSELESGQFALLNIWFSCVVWLHSHFLTSSFLFNRGDDWRHVLEDGFLFLTWINWHTMLKGESQITY